MRFPGEVELGHLHGLSEKVDVVFERGGNTVLLPHSICCILQQTLGEVLPAELVITYGETFWSPYA